MEKSSLNLGRDAPVFSWHANFGRQQHLHKKIKIYFDRQVCGDFLFFFHSTSNQPVGTRYTEYTMSYIIITRGLGRIGSLFRWVDRSLCHCRIGELATASVPEVHLFSHQHCKDLQKPSKLSLLSFMHALLQASPCMIPMQIPLKLPLRCSPQIDCPTDADSTWIRDRGTCSTFMQQVSKAHQTTIN